jgi:chromosome segregation ATPase
MKPATLALVAIAVVVAIVISVIISSRVSRTRHQSRKQNERISELEEMVSKHVKDQEAAQELQRRLEELRHDIEVNEESRRQITQQLATCTERSEAEAALKTQLERQVEELNTHLERQIVDFDEARGLLEGQKRQLEQQIRNNQREFDIQYGRQEEIWRTELEEGDAECDKEIRLLKEANMNLQEVINSQIPNSGTE